MAELPNIAFAKESPVDAAVLDGKLITVEVAVICAVIETREVANSDVFPTVNCQFPFVMVADVNGRPETLVVLPDPIEFTAKHI